MDLSVSDFLERIKKVTSLKNLENNLGYSQSTISSWKTRNVFPKADDLLKIAQYLNVTTDYLLTGEEKNNSLSQDEVELLRNYRSLPEHDKSMLQIMIAALASNSN